LRRLRLLHSLQHAHIRHVAIATSPASFYEKLLSFRYHLDHNHAPFLVLDSLTVVLDVPEALDSSTFADKLRRMHEQTMVIVSIFHYKNVKKAVIMNILYREDLIYSHEIQGHWTCLTQARPLQRDSMLDDTDPNRWQFELTSFYDYSKKPWIQ
jgi:hypothetical protein